MNSLWRFLWIFLPVFLLLFTLVYVPMKTGDNHGKQRVDQIAAEVAKLKEQNKRLRRENQTLVKQIKAIQSDPHFIENIARNEMGMITPEETVYQF